MNPNTSSNDLVIEIKSKKKRKNKKDKTLKKIKKVINKKNDFYDSVLSRYLREIDSVKLLSREEEEELARLSFYGNLEAREKLIKANLRFVVNIAKKYQKKGLPLIDLINEGNMGLITAADKFDYRKGYHFISYAVWWIKQSILKALSEKTKLIRLPLNRANQLIQIEKLRKLKGSGFNGGKEYSNKEIAKELDIEEKNLNDILNAGKDYVSLDAPIMNDKKERYLFEIISDKNYKEPDERLIELYLKEAIVQILDTLPEKEQDIIKLRYGLDGSTPMSLKEIGRRFCLTKERIRQIEKKAIRKLRTPSKSIFLKTFLKI